MNAETLRSIPEGVADAECLPESLSKRLYQEMERLVKTEEVLILSDEEIRMVKSLRKFRAIARKSGVIFTWQTTPDERAIVAGDEAGLIVDPATESPVRP